MKTFSVSEIEAVCYQSGWVQECAVVAKKHAMLDEVPVVFVKPLDHAPIDLSERLISHCKQHLEYFKVIRDVHIVNNFQV